MEEDFLIKKKDSVNSTEYLKNRRNNKKKMIIIITGILILIAAIIVIIFVSGNGKKDDKPKDNGQNQTVVTKSWKEYLEEQNFTTIKLSKKYCDNSDTLEVDLTVDQLKEMFNKFSNYKLIKQYLSESSWDCGYELEVSYTKNDKEYKLKILDNVISILEDYQDEEFIKALDDGKDSIENEDMKNVENVFYRYCFKDLDVMIYEEYL